MGTTRAWKIYYDELTDIAKGRTQAFKQANSVESALSLLWGQAVDQTIAKVKDATAATDQKISALNSSLTNAVTNAKNEALRSVGALRNQVESRLSQLERDVPAQRTELRAHAQSLVETARDAVTDYVNERTATLYKPENQWVVFSGTSIDAKLTTPAYRPWVWVVNATASGQVLGTSVEAGGVYIVFLTDKTRGKVVRVDK